MIRTLVPALLLGGALLAFALLWWVDVHFQPSLYSDGVDYAWVARELAAGRTAALTISDRPPFFPVLIALICRLTAVGPATALRSVTLGAGFLAIWMTERLVRSMVAEPRPALLAAAMTAVGIPAVSGLRFAALPDSLGLCLLIGGIGMSAAAERSLRTGQSTRQAAALALGAGLVWALAALTRTQYLPLGFLGGLMLFARHSGSSRARRLCIGSVWLAGWFMPLLLYFGFLSLAAHRPAITNEHDFGKVITSWDGRASRLAWAIISATVGGLPLVLLAGVLLAGLPPPRLTSLGVAAGRVFPWLALVMAVTAAVAVASWAERRYFLPPLWCLWMFACLAGAGRRRTSPRLLAATLAALGLTTLSYPIYAARSYTRWPQPSPAYTVAARWADATFGPHARIAVTGGRQTILLSVRTDDVFSIRHVLTKGWGDVGEWLARKQPDVVLIGPDPGAVHRRACPIEAELLRQPRSGQRLGLTYLRTFAAAEGAVHVLVRSKPWTATSGPGRGAR